MIPAAGLLRLALAADPGSSADMHRLACCAGEVVRLTGPAPNRLTSACQGVCEAATSGAGMGCAVWRLKTALRATGGDEKNT